MHLKVLGCAGAEFPGFRPPGFLIDSELLLDAGTIGAALSEEEQWALKYVFVTHAHLDHVRGIPVLADNIIIKNLTHSVLVAGTTEVVAALSDHLMNGVLWPDFTRIPTPEAPVITYRRLDPGKVCRLDGYEVTACRVSHSVPAVGYLVRKREKSLLYTGDTGPTDLIWRHSGGVSALIVEVSFPNGMERMAILTGHLTPALLAGELAKIGTLPERIFITHPKPQYYGEIRTELGRLGIRQLEMLADGAEYDI